MKPLQVVVSGFGFFADLEEYFQARQRVSRIRNFMTVEELITRLGLHPLSAGSSKDCVTGVIACDLMSEVLARARPSMAWVTVQTHINVVALASFLELPLVIVPYGIIVPDATIRHAKRETVAVACSAQSTYQLCGELFEAGLGRVQRSL